MAQRFSHCVYGRHDGGRDDGKGEYGEKADEIDQRGAREGAEPIGHLGVVEAIVDRNDDGRDCQRSDNAGVERLDAVDDGDAASGDQRRRVLKSKIVAAQLNDLAQKEAVGKIGHECLEAATCRLLLGKADGQRYGKKERKAFKDRPRAALDDSPENVPRGSVYGEVADDVRGCCESGDADHKARYGKQHSGREHCPAKALDFLQHGLPPEYRDTLRVGKRLNNGFIVEDQTIVVPAVLNETDLDTTEAVNG